MAANPFSLFWLLLRFASAESEQDGPHFVSSSVAVCLSGELRGGPEVLESVVERVLRPLAADVFVYLPLKRTARHDAAHMSPTVEELSRLYALPGLVSLHVEVEDATALLASEMRRWRPADQELVFELTRRVAGNWLGGIVEPAPESWGGGLWRRPGSGLFQQLSWRRCLEMVERAEGMAGRRYKWVVPSRTNIHWEHPHVPLELLSPDAVWIPEGMDWGGVNDRHAVVPRGESEDGRPSISEMYLEAWRFIGEGKAAAVLHMALEGGANVPLEETGCDPRVDGPVSQPCLNMETWLAMRLRATGIKVKRLPRLDWVLCQPGHAEAKWEDGPRPMLQTCARDGTPYRYADEHAQAQATAECLRAHYNVRNVWTDGTKVDATATSDVLKALRACWCPTEMPNRLTEPCDFDLGFCEADFYALCFGALIE